jgi:hypothetical protein
MRNHLRFHGRFLSEREIKSGSEYDEIPYVNNVIQENLPYVLKIIQWRAGGKFYQRSFLNLDLKTAPL